MKLVIISTVHGQKYLTIRTNRHDSADRAMSKLFLEFDQYGAAFASEWRIYGVQK